MKRHIYLKMQPVAAARESFLRRFELDKLLPPEEIPTVAARGRITAAPVYARLSSPHYHSAAMDGYAVMAELTFGAAPDRPKRLALGREAIPVNTGQPLPPGTNAVIMVENVVPVGEEAIDIEAAVYPWQHVRKVGEDIVAQEMILPEKVEITPYAIAALLAAGVTRVLVRRRPRVYIIPTGAELLPVNALETEAVAPGQIIEFNSAMLAALVDQHGGLAEVGSIIPDDPEALRQAVSTALAQADVLLINAGSSAGTEDYTASILAELGEVLVHGVAMMPGKPTILAMVAGKPVVGIPGYPVSAAMAFDQFVVPLLAGLVGRQPPARPTVLAEPVQKLPSRAGLEEYIRVTLGKVGDRLIATPLPRGAGTVTSLLRADGLLRIPSASEGVAAGELTPVELLISPEELEQTLVIVGSHDNTLDLLATLLRRHYPELRLASAHVGSTGGLMAVKQGRAHLAGSHLFDPATATYNVPYIKRLLPDLPLKLVHLVQREQGFIVLPDNPKNIRDFSDLTREGVRFTNRQRGSGTRILLDYHLEQLQIPPQQINGYHQEEYTHMAVAVNVLSGVADVGLGILAAAKALGLGFVPLVKERYELVVPAATFQEERFQKLLALIRSEAFRQAVQNLGGYDTSDTGQIVYEQ